MVKVGGHVQQGRFVAGSLWTLERPVLCINDGAKMIVWFAQATYMEASVVVVVLVVAVAGGHRLSESIRVKPVRVVTLLCINMQGAKHKQRAAAVHKQTSCCMHKQA